MDSKTPIVVKVLAAISALWIHFPPMLWTLISLITLDYLTGLAAAGAKGAIESSIARRGLWRKLALLTMAIAAFVVSKSFSLQEAGLPWIPANIEVGSAVCAWLCLTEFVSILENAGGMGIPMPPFVRQALAKFKEQQQEDKKP